MTLNIDEYVPVCGEPYQCEIPNCTNRAKWRYQLPACTVLVCDMHKCSEEARTKYGFDELLETK